MCRAHPGWVEGHAISARPCAAPGQSGRTPDLLQHHRLPLPWRFAAPPGPYLTWTRKVENKTVTRTVDATQADAPPRG